MKGPIRVVSGSTSVFRRLVDSLRVRVANYAGPSIPCITLLMALAAPLEAVAEVAPMPTPTGPAMYNQCVASMWESMTGSPYSGVNEKNYIDGKYICRDFAREHCEFVNSAPDSVSKPRCWYLGVTIDESGGASKYVNCAVAQCGTSWDVIRNSLLPQKLCDAKFQQCWHDYVVGHAINVIRTEGEFHLKTYGSVGFVVYEPQEGDPTTAAFCAWRQTKLDPPVIPERCKREIVARYFSKQAKCGVDYKFQFEDYRRIPPTGRKSTEKP